MDGGLSSRIMPLPRRNGFLVKYGNVWRSQEDCHRKGRSGGISRLFYLERLAADYEIQNRAKITWSMANCIAKDPRRRFVYAFSIENTDMRLWFCDRSKILVSEPHNFILVSMPQMSRYYILTVGIPIRIIYRSYTSSCPLPMHKISI